MNSKLYNYSIYLLGRRDYFVKELRMKFKEKGYEEDDVNVVLDYLIENGYQSDEKFTRSFINQKINSKIGFSKIKSTLVFEKGVDRDVVEDAMSEFESQDLENIRKIVGVKYRNKDLKDFKEKNKAFRFLVSKGFSFEDINQVFREI